MGWEMEVSRLRPGIRELLRLATAVPEQEPVSTGRREGVLSWLGRLALEQVSAWWDGVGFLGSVTLACLRALRGRARFRGRDVWLMLGACGPDALPIISLISFLMGLILAFVGAVQLRLFGAEIYVADLVAIGVVRAMGAIMTGIVMAGRSGAAFAAQLGTMEVNEEIDAFRTMGIDPIEFLVLPRLLALTLMMPLLCLYADVMGILGGLAVGVGLMRIGLVQYVVETRRIVGLNDLGVGLFMSVVFGILIALAGCLRGLQSGRSSAAVGQAATRAVVTGIVWIVVATAIITVLCNALGV
ncbi:MAG: ABC transporter permease [Lentisphaeria bacterium]|nr:ABC transporter permease [Lentisphaeria bacterium]